METTTGMSAPPDRHDQMRADDEGDGGHDQEGPQAARDVVGRQEEAHQDQRHDNAGEVEQVPARQHQRLAGNRALQLAEGDHGAGEGNRADEDAEIDLDIVDRLLDALVVLGGLGIDEAADADQNRGEADETVQDRHQLRHLGHLDLQGHRDADQRPDDHGRHENERRHAVGFGVEEEGDDRGRHGDRHADDAVDIAAPGGLLVAQPAQAENEQDGGADIGSGYQSGRHGVSSS